MKSIIIRVLAYNLLFVLVIFSPGISQAQIIHTDIPDTVISYPPLDDPCNIFSFSLQNDSIIDYTFYLCNWLSWIFPHAPPHHVISIDLYGFSSFFAVEVGTGPPCAIQMEYLDIINDNYEWASWYFLYYIGEIECGSFQDKYYGLKTIIDDQVHFGWIKLSITNQLTIKEYAYNSVPNEPVLAGQLYITNTNLQKQTKGLIISQTNYNISIKVNQDEKIKKVSIIDLFGRLIESKNTNQDQVLMDIGHLSAGIYILHIETTDGNFVKKTMIH